tara:strand:- start:185 stop:418 length:234 start_codon:yes stop_codon:yes gene_type:complete
MTFRIEDTIGNSFIVEQDDGRVVAVVRLYGNKHEYFVTISDSIPLAIVEATQWIMARHKADSGRTDFSFIEIGKEYL